MAKKPAGKKYDGLRGKVPEVPQVAEGTDPREDAILAFQRGNPRAEFLMSEDPKKQAMAVSFPEGPRSSWSLDDKTREYNRLEEIKAKLASATKATNLQSETFQRMIRRDIEGQNLDRVTANGYTWSPSPRPVAVVDDEQALVKYYIDNEMFDMLSVHHSRVNSHVTAEAEENLLRVVILDAKGPDGENITEVRSNLPGVKVYLKPTLGRRKASSKAAGEQSEEEGSDE